MHQRVVDAVEVEHLRPEALAQLPVERRGGLAPLLVDPELAVAVEDEQVGAHRGTQLLALQVVAHVSEPQPGRDPHGPSGGAQQHRLGHAPVRAGRDHGAGAEGVRLVREVVRVVAPSVAHGEEQRHGPLPVGRCVGGGNDPLSELDDGRMVAVQEPGRR